MSIKLELFTAMEFIVSVLMYSVEYRLKDSTLACDFV